MKNLKLHWKTSDLAQRTFDILISLIALVFFVPVLAVVALSIFYEDGRPIFFKQRRVGKFGEEFNIIKFRTMVINAEKIGPKFTEESDSRITRVGNFLRKTSLDEMPQVLNVIKGDMSIVGPRPWLASQFDTMHKDTAKIRNSVRPGITGLAQVNGRTNSTTTDRLKYDVSFVKAKSVTLYFRIIFKTVFQVLKRKGVN